MKNWTIKNNNIGRSGCLLLFAVVLIFSLRVPQAHALTPNDPYYSNIYEVYLPKIQADGAWDITTGSSSVVVAVIDSGIDTNHVELSNNIWTNTKELPGNSIDDDKNGYIDDLHGWDFAYNTRELTPTSNHGTQVAGIIGAIGNNSVGITGLSWNVKLMSLIVFDANGYSSITKISNAIHYATDNGAQIINLSIGGSGSNYDYSTAYDEAVTYAFARGVTIIAAAGNGQRVDGVGRNLNINPGSPICNDGKYNMVIGVAAIDDLDVKTSWSDYGSNCVDVAAPGFEILSTARTSHGTSGNPDYSYGSGTSFAAPIVTGVAALIKSKYPTANNVQIMDMIRRSADAIDALNPSYVSHLGTGRVNAFRALSSVPDAALTTPDLIPPSTPPTYLVYGTSGDVKTVPQLQRSPRFEQTGATDNASGIKGYYYLWTTDINADAATGTFVASASYTVPLISSSGTYYLHVKVVDGNDNLSSGVYETYLAAPDLTLPNIALTTSTSPLNGTYYAAKLIVSFKASDKVGSTTIYYHWDSAADASGSSTTAPPGTHTLTYRVEDQYGNVSPIRNVVFTVLPPPTMKVIKLTKGIYSYKLEGKTIKIRPFGTDYKGTVWARSVDFGANGKIYVFLNSGAYKKGQIRVFKSDGKILKTYNPYGGYTIDGLKAAAVIESNGSAYLVVGTPKAGTTIKVYQFVPKGLQILNSLTTNTQKGNILFGFQKLYKTQYGLVTMKQGDKKTLKVWKLDLTKNKFTEDKKISKTKIKI
ncbi:MAG: S8 family peptidase [bacterium]|nr:S8 family peptidase [bacterium]